MTQILKKLTTCFCLSLLLFVNQITAQSKTSDDATKNSYFKGSLSYSSNSVYNGRKDSLTTPYITPNLGYYDKSGFYANSSLSYLTSSTEKRIDLFAIEAGYDFDISSQFSGSIYGDKNFYNKSSTNIKSDISGSLGGNLSYDLDILQVNAGADVLFANKTDIALNGGIAHAFYIGEDDNQWTITPTATTHLSTLNFYQGYTNRRAGKNAKAPNGSTITTSTVVTNRSTGLTLLDYELSLPISYDAKSWGFSLTPTLALPTNPIYTSTIVTLKSRVGTTVLQTQNSTPISETNLNSVFYVELMVYFKF
ncbi:hypothetical protein ACFOW1_14175 [Parasediminibacterium paludis]|uniref:Uncharacterized protein n=1 Tax=Parasediminibacterium paludis TaxID=908966 RepID=A0ABV8PZS1_9BACT